MLSTPGLTKPPCNESAKHSSSTRQMPTHSLEKGLGPLAEKSNLSLPKQGVSTLQRNPCKVRQTTEFPLIKSFGCFLPLSSALIQNLDLCLVPRQWDKAVPRDNVCKGFLPCSTLECVVRNSVPHLFHSWTPNVKTQEEKLQGHNAHPLQTRDATLPPLGPTWVRERHLQERASLVSGFLPEQTFLHHPSWISRLPTPTASACGLRSHHLKNSIAHLLHSCTAPWGRTPDGGDKSTRSWLLARGFFLN